MQETVKLVIDALKPIAEKIGEGAAALFEIYTRQMWAEGLVMVIGSVFALALAIGCGILAVKAFRVADKEDSDGWFITGFVSAVIGVGAFIAVLVLPWQGLLQMINPEYYAIERLLHQVKGEQ